jgi:hypothetical protein
MVARQKHSRIRKFGLKIAEIGFRRNSERFLLHCSDNGT